MKSMSALAGCYVLTVQVSEVSLDTDFRSQINCMRHSLLSGFEDSNRPGVDCGITHGEDILMLQVSSAILRVVHKYF